MGTTPKFTSRYPPLSLLSYSSRVGSIAVVNRGALQALSLGPGPGHEGQAAAVDAVAKLQPSSRREMQVREGGGEGDRQAGRTRQAGRQAGRARQRCQKSAHLVPGSRGDGGRIAAEPTAPSNHPAAQKELGRLLLRRREGIGKTRGGSGRLPCPVPCTPSTPPPPPQTPKQMCEGVVTAGVRAPLVGREQVRRSKQPAPPSSHPLSLSR